MELKCHNPPMMNLFKKASVWLLIRELGVPREKVLSVPAVFQVSCLVVMQQVGLRRSRGRILSFGRADGTLEYHYTPGVS